MHHELPARLDLEYYRKEAKRLLRGYRRGDPDAVERVEAALDKRARQRFLLSDAQYVIAFEHGHRSWGDFKRAVEAAARERPARTAGREAVLASDAKSLRELIDGNPGLADALLEDLTQPDVFGKNLGPALGVDRRCADVIIAAAGNLDTSLGLAACFNRVELVELLLEVGADVETVEIWGVTPLETTFYHSAREAAELLAARTIVPYALWTVASLGRIDLMERFLDPDGRLRPEAGAHRPNLSNVGWPPGPPPRDDPQEILEEAFVHACHNGRTAAAAWLLDQGVEVDARPYLGVTGLHFAVQFGHLETVELLVACGADLELEDGIHHGTPLGWAEFQAREGNPSRISIRDFLAARSSSANRARSMASPAAGDRLARLRDALEDARGTWDERGDVVLDPGLVYVEGEPLEILVRKRGRRYDLSDQGAAARLAGKPPGWLDVAERVVAEEGLNVNRRGVVFVPVVEGRDLAALAAKVADTSLAVYDALLELGDDAVS